MVHPSWIYHYLFYLFIYLFTSVAGPDLMIAIFAIAGMWFTPAGFIIIYFIYLFTSVAGPDLVIAIFAIAGMWFTPAGFIIIYLFIYLFISVAGPDLVIAIFAIAGMSFTPAGFIIPLVAERSRNIKHQMFVSGLSPFIYWITNLLWDLVINIFNPLFKYHLCLKCCWLYHFKNLINLIPHNMYDNCYFSVKTCFNTSSVELNSCKISLI